MRRRAIFLAPLALLTVAGCWETPAGEPPLRTVTGPPGQFNDTDVMFAQMLVALNTPAAQMLQIAQTRTANSEIKTLAAAVAVTQADEATMMAGWLQDWQQPASAPPGSELHAAHGGLPSSGEAELAAMRDAVDTEFDKTFLNLFIGQQHQAVELARMEAATGINPAAVQLAHRVDQSRRAQITMMLKLLG